MTPLLDLLAAAALFALGLGLSFFFSGSETGFYRLSTVRLTIDANAGDRVARRLLGFSRRPGRFVATTLVGNNIANDLITIATGLGAAAVIRSEGWAEVIGTWVVTPIVFVGGELLPKNLCYLAPSHFLRKFAPLFRVVYWLFLPVTLPLAAVSHLLERLTGATAKPGDVVFGRSRLTQVLSEGRQAGLVTESQSRFLSGLLAASTDAVSDAMTPADRVFGLPLDAARAAVLDHARRFAVTDVPVGPAAGNWTGYVRAPELALSDRPAAAHLRPLPRFDHRRTKLEVLLALRTAGETLGAVTRDGRVVGIVNERGLVEQFFRAGRPLAVAAGR